MANSLAILALSATVFAGCWSSLIDSGMCMYSECRCGGSNSQTCRQGQFCLIKPDRSGLCMNLMAKNTECSNADGCGCAQKDPTNNQKWNWAVCSNKSRCIHPNANSVYCDYPIVQSNKKCEFDRCWCAPYTDTREGGTTCSKGQSCLRLQLSPNNAGTQCTFDILDCKKFEKCEEGKECQCLGYSSNYPTPVEKIKGPETCGCRKFNQDTLPFGMTTVIEATNQKQDCPGKKCFCRNKSESFAEFCKEGQKCMLNGSGFAVCVDKRQLTEETAAQIQTRWQIRV